MSPRGRSRGERNVAAHRDLVGLIRGLRNVDPERGIVFVDSRFREATYSYRELHGWVTTAARQFLDAGIRPGQTVLLALAADVDRLSAFLALAYLGAIPVSVPSPLLSQDRDAHRGAIASLAKTHRIDRILATPDLLPVLESPGISPEAGLALPRAIDGRAGETAAVPVATVTPDDVAFVQFSSGSTARPKGVRITHRNLMHNLGLIVENDRRGPESVLVSWLPLCHDMGFVGCTLSNLVVPNDLVLMDPLCFIGRPASWLARISEHRGTVTAVPNFALDICTQRVTDEQLERDAVDLSSFGYVYCGSEPVQAESVRRFEDRFAPYGLAPGSVHPVYGMAECTLIITAPPHGGGMTVDRFDGVEVPSVGHPLGDFEVRIRDESGADLASRDVGEIWVRGTSVTPGYLVQGEEKGAGLEAGWLATGDLGALDAGGRLFVTGRRKDLIIQQGRNFYGHDVAARVEELPYVRKGKVFAFSVPVGGEERVVVLTGPPAAGRDIAESGVPEPDGSYENGIRRHVLRQFGLRVHDVVRVRRIPKTTSGKVNRRLCEALYLDYLRASSGEAPGS